MKKKFVRANHAPFMTKSLRKAIMLSSKPRNRYNKSRTSENLNSYRKWRNICVKLLNSAKKDYYNNLNINHITDNKKFWKTVKPAFSDKPHQSKKIVLVDNDDIISNDADIAETINKFFVTIAESLSIRETPNKPASTEGLPDPVFAAINKFSNHPSIIKIKDTCHRSESFSFRTFTRQEIEIEIANLNSKKATTFKDVPPKLLKNVSDICTDHLLEICNYCIENSIFPTELKRADVSAQHKKGETTKKNNYRPIAFYPQYQKYLRDSATSNCLHT